MNRIEQARRSVAGYPLGALYLAGVATVAAMFAGWLSPAFAAVFGLLLFVIAYMVTLHRQVTAQHAEVHEVHSLVNSQHDELVEQNKELILQNRELVTRVRQLVEELMAAGAQRGGTV